MSGCGVTNTRIVGGQDAAENQFPWQCTILKNDDLSVLDLFLEKSNWMLIKF